MSPKEILMKYVVKNKFVWFLCIANAFVYLIRFGVINWVPIYLTTVKGFTKQKRILRIQYLKRQRFQVL